MTYESFLTEVRHTVKTCFEGGLDHAAGIRQQGPRAGEHPGIRAEGGTGRSGEVE